VELLLVFEYDELELRHWPTTLWLGNCVAPHFTLLHIAHHSFMQA
jgi:hypothetical protein